MTEETPNLVLDMLRDNREQHRKTHAALAEVKHHVLSLRESVAQLGKEDSHIYQLIAEQAARIERLEERLNIKD